MSYRVVNTVLFTFGFRAQTSFWAFRCFDSTGINKNFACYSAAIVYPTRPFDGNFIYFETVIIKAFQVQSV